MTFSGLRRLTTALICAACVALLAVPASAQGTDPKPEGGRTGDPNKDSRKKADEFAEAARLLSGPAGHPECVWLGRRVVNLLWRDDLDTAFRHLDLYDRFGCPSPHVQMTFRCVVRQGDIDHKAPESLSSRVHACWVNPSLTPQAAAPHPSGAPAAQ